MKIENTESIDLIFCFDGAHKTRDLSFESDPMFMYCEVVSNLAEFL